MWEQGVNFFVMYLPVIVGHNNPLRRLGTLGSFAAISAKGDNFFVTSCLFYYKPSIFWKGIFSKRKEFAPMGSKFFPFKKYPFLEERKNNFEMVVSPESFLLKTLCSQIHKFEQVRFTKYW